VTAVTRRAPAAHPSATTMEAALEELHAESFGWALACCDRDRTLAEDVLQAAYVKVLDGRAVFEGRSSLKTFLFGVIRRTAMEHRRARWLDAGGLLRRLVAPPSVAVVADPELEVLSDERSRALAGALERLSRRQKEVLHLVFYQDLTLDEAASLLGIAPGSARRHYDRGKARLRRLLGEDRRG